MNKRIGDYGIIGDSRTAALVGNDGSIDWLCLPFLDSPSVFAALLDEDKGGHFSVSPVSPFDSTSLYRAGTNILTTTFRTPQGRLQLDDFLAASASGGETRRGEGTRLYRCAEVLQGEMEVIARFEPRFDYAREAPCLNAADGAVIAVGEGQRLALLASRLGMEVDGGTASGRWHLTAGQKLWFLLCSGDDRPVVLHAAAAEEALACTERYWHRWLALSETGEDFDFGPFREMMERSSLVLKLLEFAPTGAMAAAATTSLPEEIGGERNWDYRFSWIRDAAMTVEALFNIGHLSELEKYLRWLERFICERQEALQVLYGLRGETELTEGVLTHLSGYKGSRPVRVGNAAYAQKQLDIYGEIMDAALRLSNYAGKIEFSMWPFFRSICETVVRVWREKDSGIWEVRGGPYHFVYSKVMCWVALDRGLTIARRYGFPGDFERWTACRESIRREVLERGWSQKKQAFVQHYETDALDAANLLFPFYGFLSYEDPRMLSTVEAIQRELTVDGFVYRYRSEDHLAGTEGIFLVCSFWLVDNLIGQGRLEEAMVQLLRLEKSANQLGLFAEQYDPAWDELLGNYPQAFSHIGYINSVFALCRARQPRKRAPARTVGDTVSQKLLLTQRFLLNAGSVEAKGTPEQVVGDLKHKMNTLRGAFFRTAEGRVAYEEMAESSLFWDYVECSRQLQHIHPSLSRDREERIALWINLFNVMVVHGVVALGIRDSVKEVSRFFRRICYRVGELEFSADDVEHGILRANHCYPHSILHPFGSEDPRRDLMIEPLDPRIHFALVCASASCPPIEIYSAETLDHDLEVSGKTFLNSGGVRIDRQGRIVRLPKIFQWYGEDFGETDEEHLRFVAPYLYRDEDRQFLEQNAAELRVKYEPYDWRLNRT
ncbi:glycoside hydrolase family 15 protein [Thioalkalivibrio sp.]|uniref:glycoside hydrolase family 15 protein n=1 Tax=Thioalkalivibrio sp. TaxID=2093813 RepID=UPI003568F8D6